MLNTCVIREIQVKPQWNTTLHPQGWLESRSQSNTYVRKWRNHTLTHYWGYEKRCHHVEETASRSLKWLHAERPRDPVSQSICAAVNRRPWTGWLINNGSVLLTVQRVGSPRWGAHRGWVVRALFLPHSWLCLVCFHVVGEAGSSRRSRSRGFWHIT